MTARARALLRGALIGWVLYGLTQVPVPADAHPAVTAWLTGTDQ